MKIIKKNLLMVFMLIIFSVAFVGCGLNSDNSSNQKTYTVKFMVNNAIYEIKNVKENMLVEKPTDPSLSNYRFDGWYYESEKWLFSENKITSNIVLNAKLTPVYDVTFMVNNSIYQISKVVVGEKLKEPQMPNILNYKFEGWFYNNEKWLFEENLIDKNITLEAKFDYGYVISGKSIVQLSDYGRTLNEIYIHEGITKIETESFKDATNLKNIIISNSVTEIEKGAFNGCTALEKLSIPFVGKSETEETFLGFIFGADIYYDNSTCVPSSLKEISITNCKNIGDLAFYNCQNLEKIELTDKIINIGDSAFYNCYNLKNINIPNSLKSIGDSAFEYCNKLDFKIYDNVKYLGNSENLYIILVGLTNNNLINCTINRNTKIICRGVFKNCNNLSNLYYEGSVEQWCKIDFCNYDSNPMYSAENFYLKNKNGEYLEITEIDIPKSIDTIKDYSFYGFDNLTKITIFDNVKSIGKMSFYNCSKLEYNVDNYAKYLGNSENPYLILVEANNKSITSYNGNNKTKIILSNAFENCTSLLSINISSSVVEIGDFAFAGCKNLINVNFIKTSKLLTIGKNVFYNCGNLLNITIPSSVTSIGDFAFAGCDSLENIIFDNNSKLVNIGESAFSDCLVLTKIIIPNSVTQLGKSSFYNCTSLSSVTLPNELMFINEYTFYNCIGLTSIAIPTRVKSIGKSAFYGCINLESVLFGNNSKLTNIESKAFYNCGKLSIIKLPTELKSIGDYAFYNCSKLENITISNGVLIIGNYAFYNCGKLTNIEFSNSLKTIGNYAFYNCSGLIDLTLPNSLKIVGEHAFWGLSFLNNIYYLGTIEQWCNIEFIDWASNPMFYMDHFYIKDENGEYKEVTEIVIPETITNLNSFTFYGFRSLSKVVLSENLESIGEYAFYLCENLSEVIIPSSVTSIESNAFYKCTNLKNIIFEKESNWLVTIYGNPTIISSTELLDLSTAVDYLTNKYSNYDWERVS